VYDVSGRVVTTLVDQVREPGVYSSLWNGTDEVGNELGSGIYFVRMTAGSYSGTIKVGLLR
jgi:flagellar hook assembly protein FlgD